MNSHVIAVVLLMAAGQAAAESGKSAMDALKMSAGEEIQVSAPAAAQPAVKGELAFAPVSDPSAPGGIACRSASGLEGLNDIDLGELARTKMGYCGNFRGVSIPKELDLRGADLRGAQFVYAAVIGVRFEKADLTGALFFAVDGYWAKLADAVMTGVTIENSTFGHGDFRRVRMENASIRGVMLYGVRMSGAVLDGADMRGCAMYGDGATLAGASLRGADLRNSYFTNYEAYGGSDNTTDFDGTLLEGSIYNEKSRFPFDAAEAARRGMTLRPGEY